MSTRRPPMAATVLRGVRSRALLSVGSVLLIALAIGSAVLGPIFQVASTNSYLVTRLNEAPNVITGLTWVFAPEGGSAPTDALTAGIAAADEAEGPFSAGRARLESNEFDVFFEGRGHLIAADDACAHLVVEGGCPQAANEILVLSGDAEQNGVEVGDTLEAEPGVGPFTVVGTYRAPSTEEDFWFDLQRFASRPMLETASGAVLPYRPAPFVTVVETFEGLTGVTWSVRVDRRLEAPPDLTLADVDLAVQTAATVVDGESSRVDGGLLRGESINDLVTVAAETRAQQETARDSITPALVSLVLVALALLMRLLMAAADLRIPELSLASLRGLSRRQMWALGMSEPLMLLAFAVPLGAVLGVAMALALVRWWLVPGLPLPLPATAVVTGALVVVAAFVVAVLAVHLVLRVSLSEQLTGVRRPKASGRLAIILQLVLVALAAAVLVSKLSGGGPGDPDATDLVLPVLLAVVAGLGATRATALLARWWTRRRRRTRSLPGFVASRAISRRQEGTLVILPVTAAIAIGVFGIGVHASAAEWRESVAATTAPADEVWRSPLPLNESVALTRELDPDGDYLMAASTMSTLGPTYSILDTTRLARVSAWQDQWTPGFSVEDVVERIGLQAEIPIVRGREIGLTVDNRADVAGDDLRVRLRLDVVGGRPHFVFLGPFPSGETTTATARAPFCRTGCRLDGLTLGGPAALPVEITGEVLVSDITVDGEPVPGGIDGAGWGRAPEASAGDRILGVETVDGVLSIEVSSGGSSMITQLTSGALPERLPVVRGVLAPSGANKDSFGETTSPTEFPTDPVVRGESTPLLGPQGVMIDYNLLTTGREVYQQDVPVYVFARGDTPASLQQELADRGLSVETTLAGVKRTLDQGAYALALRLYAVVAVMVLVMALAGLFVSTAVQLPARRRDAASLRVVGVPRRSVMSAVVRELAVVLGGTALAGLAAGTLAQYVVLRTVTLGVVDDVKTPALVAAVSWERLVLLAALATLLFGVVALASAALTVRGARGATLRENAR